MKPFYSYSNPIEFKIVALRECMSPGGLTYCDQAPAAVNYWKAYIETSDYFNPEAECMVVLLLNTRKHIKAHQMIGIGTLDSVHSHPREVFRGAILGCASAVVILHNHPSGDPTPSEADIRVTRDLIRAGQLLKIEVLDHIIVGATSHVSLRELGFFYS